MNETAYLSLLPFRIFRCTIQLSILTTFVSTSNSVRNSTFYSIPSCLSLTAALNLSSKSDTSLIRSVMAFVNASCGL